MATKILYFVKGDPTHSASSRQSSRQRVWTPAERLKKEYGYEYEVVHDINYKILSLSLKRFKTLLYAFKKLFRDNYDIIFVQKILIPFDIIFLIFLAKKLRGKKLVFDMDDAQWVPSLHAKLKTIFLTRRADKVFCGSNVILGWSLEHNKNSVLMQTAFNEERHIPHRIEHKQSPTMTIGWVGAGKGHFKHGVFHIIKPALEELGKRRKIRFVLIGAMHYEPLKEYIVSNHYETVLVDFVDPDTIPRLMKEYDFAIGLMPLIADKHSIAKCSGKAIEYMASGIPAIVSPVGENAVVIDDGYNGFWAETTEEWIEKMDLLLSDLEFRKKMAVEAIKRMEERYSVKAILPKMHKEFQSLINP